MTSGKRVRFEKWEGLGNDFVVVEEDAAGWSDERVRSVCDRRRGVGADGVLFVTREDGQSLPREVGRSLPSDEGQTLPSHVGPAAPGEEGQSLSRGEGHVAARMVVRNADGSRPEMCGNGIRCVAGFLAEEGDSGPVRSTIAIATDAGVKRCAVGGGDGRFEVAVAMGPARVVGTLAAEVAGSRHVFTQVDVGNPHAITFEPYEESAVDVVGPAVATLPAGGTNVEFCQVVRGESPRVDVVVWERGVGRTLACGTGACAVASAACAAGYFAYDAPTRVRLPGGDLSIVVAAGSLDTTMTGPARRVFVGELVFSGESESGLP